jgi:hypothetical protein
MITFKQFHDNKCRHNTHDFLDSSHVQIQCLVFAAECPYCQTLQHAQKEDPQSVKAMVKMECSSMLHEMYFTHFMLLPTTRNHNWFLFLLRTPSKGPTALGFYGLHKETRFQTPWPGKLKTIRGPAVTNLE